MTETQTDERTRELIDKLVSFRAGLDEGEREMLDSLVRAAFHGDGGEESAPSVRPSKDEVEALGQKLGAFVGTLDEAEGRLLEGRIKQAVGAPETEVEAHSWTVEDFAWNNTYYRTKCAQEGGAFAAWYDWWFPFAGMSFFRCTT